MKDQNEAAIWQSGVKKGVPEKCAAFTNIPKYENCGRRVGKCEVQILGVQGVYHDVAKDETGKGERGQVRAKLRSLILPQGQLFMLCILQQEKKNITLC